VSDKSNTPDERQPEEEPQQPGTPESQEAMPSLTSTKLAAVVEVVMQTPREQREEVVNTRTAEFAASVPIEDRNVLTQVARSLESNLSKLAEASHR